jgi:hypothetical protein
MEKCWGCGSNVAVPDKKILRKFPKKKQDLLLPAINGGKCIESIKSSKFKSAIKAASSNCSGIEINV